MQKPSGVRANEAIKRADANLDQVRATSLAAVDGHLDQLEHVTKDGGAHPSDDVKLRIYTHSNNIHAVAGVCGLGELSQAALSLCDLVDTFRTLGRWNMAAVEVHLIACRILRQGRTDVDHSSVVENLQGLTEHAAAIAQ